jgi:hypothetical protein
LSNEELFDQASGDIFAERIISTLLAEWKGFDHFYLRSRKIFHDGISENFPLSVHKAIYLIFDKLSNSNLVEPSPEAWIK